jgi:hypothetical protein
VRAAIASHGPRGQSRRCLLAGLALLISGNASSAARDDEQAEFTYAHNAYQYTYTTALDADVETVTAIVTDFERLHRLNDGITASRVLERYDEHHVKRLLDGRQCVLMFCFELRLVEDVRVTPGRVHARVIPGEGSFREGTMEWHYTASDSGRTRISFRAAQTLDIWIPPVIGPLVLKRVFLREVRETCASIERLARSTATSP